MFYCLILTTCLNHSTQRHAHNVTPEWDVSQAAQKPQLVLRQHQATNCIISDLKRYPSPTTMKSLWSETLLQIRLQSP